MIWTKEQIIDKLKEAKEDDIFELTKKREKSIRSIAQNKYYFGVVISEISNYHWYTPVETHELIKITVWVETTTNLSTSEFKFMCEMIIDLWKTKFDVVIPKPNEVQELVNLEKYLF